MKLLIIRFSSIGDIIMTTPVVRCLKKQTQAEIHFVTKASFTELISHNPYIDKIHAFNGDWKTLIQKLKSENFDEIIDLHVNTRSRRIIASLGVPSYKINKLSPHKLALIYLKIDHLPQVHFAHRALDTIAHLGVKDDNEGMEMFLEDIELPAAFREKEYACLALGTTHFTKNMPKDLLEYIIENHPLPLVLLGGPKEAELGEELKEQFGEKVTHLAGTISLLESAAYAKNSKCVIAGDTGILHMACALKVPTISIWGATIPEFGVYPYYGKYDIPHRMHQVNLSCRPCSKHGGSRCPKGHFKCMKDQDRLSILGSMTSLT